MSRLVAIASQLAKATRQLEFSRPVAYVYRPLDYAWRPHRLFLERYGEGKPEQRVLLVGMNPGPWGMTQTGVPFGSVELVTSWLGIDRVEIDRPKIEHPKRPVMGFECSRVEVSGDRLWSWARDRFGTPDRFFRQFFVSNYCPLLFLEASGRNLTPDKLALDERRQLLEICDRALRQVVELVRPSLVVGVGVWAEQRARTALGSTGAQVARILHPSPASPIANRGWAAQAERQLRDLGISLPVDRDP